MKFLSIGVIFCVLLLSCIDPKNSVKYPAGTNGMTDEKNSFIIGQKSVTGQEFDRFLKSLKENPHTWYCAELKDGGETGYDATDEKGNVYRVRLRSSGGAVRNTIVRKDAGLPE